MVQLELQPKTFSTDYIIASSSFLFSLIFYLWKKICSQIIKLKKDLV